VVDVLGMLVAVVVHATDVQDRYGAQLVLIKLVGRLPGLTRRLSNDKEGLPETREAWIQIAMNYLMLKRLAQ